MTSQEYTEEPVELTLAQAKKYLPVDLADLNLSSKEIRFVVAYCTNNFVATKAYRMLGVKDVNPNIAKQSAMQMLVQPGVATAISRYVETMMRPFKGKLEFQVLDIWYRRATYSIEMFVDENNNLIPIKNIPQEWRCCIDGIEKKSSGAIDPLSWHEYVLPNRDKALDALVRVIQTLRTPVLSDIADLPAPSRDKLEGLFSSESDDQELLSPPPPKKMRIVSE